jgi:aspartate beta-hydroxylase/beta-hydroxylase
MPPEAVGTAGPKPAMKGSISHNSAFLRGLLNRLFIAAAGGSRRPPLMRTEDVFPEGLEFQRRFEEVRGEIERLLEKRSLRRYQDIDPARAAEVSADWKLYYAYFLWEENANARTELPVTLSIVKSIPHAMNATVAVLEPGVSLAAHAGPYAGVLRYHLGIRVPRKNPPRLRVHDRHYTWKAGESIVLDDVFDHEVYNEAEEIRVILMVDFMRPMNPVCHALNRWCLTMKNRWGRHMIEQAMAP